MIDPTACRRSTPPDDALRGGAPETLRYAKEETRSESDGKRPRRRRYARSRGGSEATIATTRRRGGDPEGER